MTNGDEIEPVTASDIVDADALTPVDPGYRTMLRVTIGLAFLPLLIAAGVLETLRPFGNAVPQGVLAAPMALLFALLMWRWPNRRYDARGYDLGSNRLRVVRGIWWRSDTVVPLGRVQHIDVTRGPIERLFGLSTLVLHTAGNHNHAVPLPGLRDEDALAMREQIRAHIKREAQ